QSIVARDASADVVRGPAADHRHRGIDPELRVAGPELRRGGRQAHVARHRDGEAAADAPAADRRDDRLADRLDTIDDAASELAEAHRLVGRARAAGEGSARPDGLRAPPRPPPPPPR